jgi:hypothetical protein
VLRDTVESLVRHGFERLYFLNGHGGNIATVTAAFSEIYAARSLAAAANLPPVKCRLRNWWNSQEVRQLAKELYGDAEGAHATPSEVAVTQFAYPDAIKSARRCRRLPPRVSRRPHRIQPCSGDPRSGPAPLRCCRCSARQGLFGLARRLRGYEVVLPAKERAKKSSWRPISRHPGESRGLFRGHPSKHRQATGTVPRQDRATATNERSPSGRPVR